METRKLAFLGLGVMGFPMAGHLARAGHEVTVYNRTASRAEKWLASTPAAQKSSSAPTPAAAAAGASMVMMCVGNDDDVRAVALGPDGARAPFSSITPLRRQRSRAKSITRRRLVASAFSMPRSPADRRARRTAS